MKKRIVQIVIPMLIGLFDLGLAAQHTFSIVAIDSVTGEVGSAGATCLDDNSFPGSGGAIIISDVIPGKGAVHTQSYWENANQVNANRLLDDGETATDILDWLINNDIAANPAIRQYGAVTMGNTIDAAGFTGDQCLAERVHVTGNNYAIQGNILISQAVVDSMEARFLQTEGRPLCERLMEALQGANITGADSRCFNEGVSSRSAFVRVAKMDDEVDDLWMDLNVPVTPFGVEPIDELQKLFDEFKSTLSLADVGQNSLVRLLSSNPSDHSFILGRLEGASGDWTCQVFELSGRQLMENIWPNGQDRFELKIQEPGSYLIKVEDEKLGDIIFTTTIIAQ